MWCGQAGLVSRIGAIRFIRQGDDVAGIEAAHEPLHGITLGCHADIRYQKHLFTKSADVPDGPGIAIVGQGERVDLGGAIARKKLCFFARPYKITRDTAHHEHQVAFFRGEDRLIPIHNPEPVRRINHDIPRMDVGVAQHQG